MDPQLEKAVKQAINRSMAVGLMIGFLVGIFAAAAVIAYNVNGKLITNPQPVRLFGFGSQVPHLSGDAPLVAWMDVNAGDYNGQPISVFLCPTPYGVRMLPTVGEVNASVVNYLVNACISAQHPPKELNVEVNG